MICFLQVEGAYTSRCQMPEEFLFDDSLFVGLSQEGAYTSRCQMPDFEQNEDMEVIFIMAMVYIQVTIQNHLGPWIDNEMWG